MSFTEFKSGLRGAIRDLTANHMMPLSAGLAYYFVLSLFPLLIFLASVLVYLPIPNLFDQVLATMARVVPPDGMGLVRKVLHDVLSHGHPKLLSVGILGTLYAATGGFGSMIEALNVAYDVPETRPWWRTKLLAIELTFIIGVLFIVALGVLVVGPEFGAWLAGKIHLGPVFAFTWNYLRWGVAIAFTVVGIELLYFRARRMFAIVSQQRCRERHWLSPLGSRLPGHWACTYASLRTLIRPMERWAPQSCL